jgi:hypothetical protein
VTRPEITGRKCPSKTPRAVYTIPEFCVAHQISESFYFKLKAEGLGPEEMELGSRRLISFESAKRWRAKNARKARAAHEVVTQAP